MYIHWNEYLTHLTAALESTMENISMYKDNLTDLMQLNPEDMIHQKVALAKAQGIQEALAWAMELPKTLMENGKVARSFYEEERK